MRKNHRLEKFRIETDLLEPGFEAFQIGQLRVISGTEAEARENRGWEHVSVSCRNRVPTWSEMSQIKRMFWGNDEQVVQIHPREEDYVNQHQFCLHLWSSPELRKLLDLDR